MDRELPQNTGLTVTCVRCRAKGIVVCPLARGPARDEMGPT
jgi:hypothetical protein